MDKSLLRRDTANESDNDKDKELPKGTRKGETSLRR